MKRGDGAAMTTGECCHLPGSLCDCTGNVALSKTVEESDVRRAHCITQVTAKDGRLLSTVIKSLGTQSDGPICRICHEGASAEGLLSPCDCTGTLGTVHKSCLERWLSSSNTSYCELCHTEFSVERRPRALTEVNASVPALPTCLNSCLCLSVFFTIVCLCASLKSVCLCASLLSLSKCSAVLALYLYTSIFCICALLKSGCLCFTVVCLSECFTIMSVCLYASLLFMCVTVIRMSVCFIVCP
uniref:E3 ubiquitin-protein ligase MARCHF2 n=1 Tax=Paramormyrops kingsleyae TaxID=1676925 RepID=A0A3B3SJU5_9TELE